MKKEVTFSLKDQLFNKEKLSLVIENLEKAYSKFEAKKFEKAVLKEFPNLELKERIEHIVDQLEIFLTGSYKKDLKIILKALPEELDPNKTDNDFGQFIWVPFSVYISRNGCTKENLKISLDALSETTKRFSAEGDIRFFINKFPKETFTFMKKMSKSKNYHQRRLSSEGFRPKLPWCIGIDFKVNAGGREGALGHEYQKAGEILDDLFLDKTRYVTRSVANHLNDISKIDPAYVLDKLLAWEKSGKQNEKEMEFIKNHSLRTLVKDGNKEALKYLGFGSKPKLKEVRFEADRKVKVGNKLNFSFEAVSLSKQNLIIDYKIFFQTKSGKESSKVFKFRKATFDKDQKISLSKHYSFQLKTTKAFYPGRHKIEILINGDVISKEEFNLSY